jgi:sugar phosphate isomerase/epimerase
MKICVSSYSLLNWREQEKATLEDCLDWLADQQALGVCGVEFAGLDDDERHDTPRRAAQLRKHAEKLGLAVAGYCIGAELLCPPDKQRQAVERLRKHVDIAAALGVRTMRHDVTRGFDRLPDPVPGPRTFANTLRIVVPAIRQVADYASEQGVKTTLENHGFYMQASRRVEKLLRAVDHPNFALTLDMGNFMCVNEDPVKAVGRLAKYAVMAHTKDFHVKRQSAFAGGAKSAGRRQPLPATHLGVPRGWFATPTPIALRGAILGHGDVDVAEALATLRRAGYRGWLSLEFEGLEEPRLGVRLGLEYLQRLLPGGR